MSDSKAYSFLIGSQNSSSGENDAVHQSSPTWVVTFVRWSVQDTFRTNTNNQTVVRDPLVVENDCISVETVSHKGTLTPSVKAVLVETDVNYETAIHPGDFMFVNMLNWESDSRRVANQSRAKQSINGTEDGFKGIYKVQGVRKTVTVDAGSGIKRVLYSIDGYAFTEFNNTIYFNPNLINVKNLQNQGLFIADIAPAWAAFAKKGGVPFIQELIAFLIQNLIGCGVNQKALNSNGLVASNNVHFLVPTLVGSLLGISQSVIAAKDIYVYLFGIQQYAVNNNASLATGMNPSNLRPNQAYPGFYYTNPGSECQGNSLLKPEYWNQVQVWSILNQYTNSPLNEMYACFRTSPTGNVMPTVVFRQIPFTNEDFATQTFNTLTDSSSHNIAVTKFLNIPRWKLDSSAILSLNIGRDEAARINFVQYYAKSNFSINGIELAQETLNNFVFDKDDITRSGLRPYIVQNQFDDTLDNLVKSAPVWARILADALIGGHLKMNGTINLFGIVEPIAVGDNIELEGVVYHIEQVSHTCSIEPASGVKAFRTTLNVSHGLLANSTYQGTKYAEMIYPDAYGDRNNDYKDQQILPGISESQDVIYRPNNVDVPRSTGIPFIQPSIKKNIPETGDQ